MLARALAPRGAAALRRRAYRAAASPASQRLGEVDPLDMRSDTLTRPTERMRAAVFQAKVGDDVFGDDPTVRELEGLGARLMGKEACAFVCTGTQGNLTSIMAHCDRRASELICGDRSHVYLHEQGGAATLAGVHTRAVRNEPDGTMDLDALVAAIRPCTGADTDDGHYPRTAMVVLENTHNDCGGVPLPVDYVRRVKQAVAARGVKLHMDGARAGNAAVALGVELSEVCGPADSISLCLSKGLGAPVGSLVAGDAAFVARVRRARKALGGGWRQAGLLAAAGVVALETMKETLARDHRVARDFAAAIARDVPGARFLRAAPASNMVFFGVEGVSVDEVCAAAEARGLRMGSGYGARGDLIRAVVHRDVGEEELLGRGVEILKQAVEEARRAGKVVG